MSTLIDVLFDPAGVGLCLVGPDGKILRANTEWLRSSGLSADEVVGRELQSLLPGTREAALALHASARAGHRVEVPRHTRKVNGRETWWEGSIEPISMPGGTGLLITARETTPGRQGSPEEDTRIGAELQPALALTADAGIAGRAGVTGALREPRERLPIALEHARDGARDPRVPEKRERTLPLEGDIGDLQLADVIDAQEVQAMMDQLYQLARIPMAVVDTAGKVLVIVGWQDICFRFHRVHHETCANCIESDTTLSTGIPAGEIRRYRCKNNMWDMASPIVVGGHHLGNVFAGQFFFNDEQIDYESFRAQAARYGFDERSYLAALDAVPRLSRDAVAAGMTFLQRFARILSSVSFNNIRLARTLMERESLTRSLEESNARLEKADRNKTEFLGVLSHELRNPLTPIRNCVYIASRASPGSDQQRNALRVIERQVQHVTRLVDDLLDVTRIARGKIQLKCERVDLRALVQQGFEDHRVLFEKNGLELALEAADTPLLVMGDPVRLAQVVGNLLQNAAKFTSAGSRTTLSVRVIDDRAAELTVADTGPGITPEVLPHLFEPFVQAEQTLARSEGGLGLGLALVKSIVTMHGGEVTARSPGEGHGTEFVVTLPLDGQHAVQAPSATPVGERSPVERRQVLVVDDNKDAADTLAAILEIGGHRVAKAHDGPTALALALANPPDVVLCDIGLPGMDGYEVARRLRAAGAKDLRLIAVSGYAQPEDIARATDAGFDAHVAKPPAPEEIVRLLEPRSGRW